MAITMATPPRYQWDGLSSDTKPTDSRVGVNDLFFETDTGNFFIYNGTSWSSYPVGGSASGASGLSSSNSVSYVPLFTSLALNSPTGLSVAANGGLVATVDNVAGTGNIIFPRSVDYTKPWRFACLVEVNDARTTVINLNNGAGNNRSGVQFNLSTSKMDVNYGFVATSANNYSTPGIPAGTQFWITVASDGVRVTWAAIPTTMTGGFANATGSSTNTVANGVFKTSAFNAILDAGMGTNGGSTAWQNIGQFSISNPSTLNRVIGYYFCADSLAGTPDTRFSPPFVIETTIYQDKLSFVFGAGTYGNAKSSVCMLHHQYTQNGDFQSQFGSTDSGGGSTAAAATLNVLWKGGFTLISVTGCSQLFGDSTNTKEASAQNWGAPTGMAYRKAAYEWIKTYLPQAADIVHLGYSMGGLNSLNYEMQFQGKSKAICTISAVADINATYSIGSFSSNIQRGHGRWYVCTAAVSGATSPGSDSTHWKPINFVDEILMDVYFSFSTYNNRNLWTSGTSYNANDIVSVDSSLTATQIADFDPTVNPRKLIKIPIMMRHSLTDPTIPSTQSSNLVTAVNAAGGNAIFVPAGTGHVTADVFDPTAILNFFTSYTSASPSSGSASSIYANIAPQAIQTRARFSALKKITASYSVDPAFDEIIAADCTGGSLTITLPSASISSGLVSSSVGGDRLVIKRIDSSANTVTVAAIGSDTIDGSASVTVAALGALRLSNDGTSVWYQI